MKRHYIVTATDRAKFGRIRNVEVRLITYHPDGSQTVPKVPQTMSVQEVVDRLCLGEQFTASIWNSRSGEWEMGRPVDFNLFTHADRTESNNLDHLPDVDDSHPKNTARPAFKRYLVTESDKNGSGIFHRVTVRPAYLYQGENKVAAPLIVTSGWTVDAIAQGIVFETAKLGDDGWVAMAKVDYYLRSHADGTTTNNLDKLPPLGQAMASTSYAASSRY